MATQFGLLSTVRSNLAAALVPPAAGSQRLGATYDLEIQKNGAAAGVPRITVSGEAIGPGDVIAVNRAMISRVEPAPGLRGFEPNYMPFVEFVDADFPWRYSLDVSSDGRTKPWLVLIALAADEFSFIAQVTGPLPRIQVSSAKHSLPDLAQSWASAHVQVRRADGSTQSLTDIVAANPAAAFSRSMCQRKLKERTAYYLFLVPSYEAGRLAGLGKSGPATVAPAWDDTKVMLDLPVYFQSTFSTNELEDVEALVRRLKAFDLLNHPEYISSPKADASAPGYYSDYTMSGIRTFNIQAALQTSGTVVEPLNTDQPLKDKLISTLTRTIAGEAVAAGQDGPNAGDPLVGLPPYGWRFRLNKTFSTDPVRQQSLWFERTNLDLKFRNAAALGAQTVKSNQEFFSQKCWEQFDEIVAANKVLNSLHTAQTLVERLMDNHYSKLAPEVSVALSEPLHAYAPMAAGATVQSTMAKNGIPSSYAGRALRRMSAKRSTRVSQSGIAKRVIPSPAIPGDTNSSTSAGHRAFIRMAAPANSITPEISARAKILFGSDAFLQQSRKTPLGAVVGAVSSASMQTALVNLVRELPRTKGPYAVNGLTVEEYEAIAPVYRRPLVPLALCDYLEELAAERLVAGIDSIPDNSVVVLEENRMFIEAYMVGANHEMNNELRSREFPTDLRTTVFHRFWNRAGATTAMDDIPAISDWTKPLGLNFPAQSTAANLVLSIKGDIVRKLGQLIVVVRRTVGTGSSPTVTDYTPVFFGRVGAGVVYYGFDIAYNTVRAHLMDYKFVLYEPVGQLRFGLDVATASVRLSRRNYRNLSLPLSNISARRSNALGAYANAVSNVVPGPPPAPQSLDDLSWAHMTLKELNYIDFDHTTVAFNQVPYIGPGATSASVVRAFWQKPLSAELPASMVLS